MKTVAREEFKTRFDGSDKPLENTREAVGPDGRLDEEVNKELEWEESEANLKGLKNGRAGGVDGIRNELLKAILQKLFLKLDIFQKNSMWEESNYFLNLVIRLIQPIIDQLQCHR